MAGAGKIKALVATGAPGLAARSTLPCQYPFGKARLSKGVRALIAAPVILLRWQVACRAGRFGPFRRRRTSAAPGPSGLQRPGSPLARIGNLLPDQGENLKDYPRKGGRTMKPA